MIENSERIQSILNNIIEQTTIIKNDFNSNGKTHYAYILEKMDKALWDVNCIISIAKHKREELDEDDGQGSNN